MSAPTMSRLSLSVTCLLAACTGTSGDPAVPGLEPSPVAQAEGLLLVACLADDFLVAGSTRVERRAVGVDGGLSTVWTYDASLYLTGGVYHSIQGLVPAEGAGLLGVESADGTRFVRLDDGTWQGLLPSKLANPVAAGQFLYGFSRASSADPHELVVLDLGNPKAPVIVSRHVATPGRLVVQGSTLFHLEGERLVTWSLEEPAAPRRLASFEFGTTVNGLGVHEGFAYTGAGDTLARVDVADPSAPVGTAPVPVSRTPFWVFMPAPALGGLLVGKEGVAHWVAADGRMVGVEFPAQFGPTAFGCFAGRHLVYGHQSPLGDEDTVFVSFPAR